MWIPLFLALALAASAGAGAGAGEAGYAEKQLLPGDEATPGFSRFREELKETIARKDVPALLARLAPEVQSSFGAGASSHEAFRKEWKLDHQPEKSRLWPELGRVLAEGASRETATRFSAPHYYARWPEAFDPFEYSLVYGKEIPLYAKASTKSKVVRKVTFLILQTEYSEGAWAPVTLPNGKKAFVENKHVRSAVGYRALFEEQNGRWVLTTFLAGD